MAYSRWGSRGSGHWYTFWKVHYQDMPETYDNTIFSICSVKDFTAKELRENLSACLSEVHELDPVGDLDELQIYINEFLRDVEKEYLKIGQKTCNIQN